MANNAVELRSFPPKTEFCVIQQPANKTYVVAAFLPTGHIDYIRGFKTESEAVRWKIAQDIRREKADIRW